MTEFTLAAAYRRQQALGEAYEQEEIHHRARAVRRQSALSQQSVFTGLSVSKLVQYVVTAPPVDSVLVSKLVQYVVTAPPVDSVLVSKLVQYVVVNSAPSPVRNPRIIPAARARYSEELELESAGMLSRAMLLRRTRAYYTPDPPPPPTAASGNTGMFFGT